MSFSNISLSSILSSSDLCKDIAIQQQIDGLDVSSCLEWPTIQQDALAFNELSDVIVDSYRLNKETAILLKLLGKLSCFLAIVYVLKVKFERLKLEAVLPKDEVIIKFANQREC